jgi:hypothetical protein
LLADIPRGFVVRFDDASTTGLKSNQETVQGKTLKEPVFIPGLHKDALLLDQDELRFPALDNLSINNGALSFWFKPLDWGEKDIHFLPIFAVDGGGGSSWTILLYFSRTPQSMQLDFRMKMPDGREIINQVVCRDSFRADDWNHVVLSWTNQESVIYFNGGRPHLQTYGLPMPRKEVGSHGLYFMPASFWRVQNTHKTALDEIEFFGSAMTDSEAKQHFMKHASGTLKIQRFLTTVPLSKAEVKLDGALNSTEWADASRMPLQISTALKSLYPTHPAWVHVKRDEQYLYIGYEIDEQEKLVMGCPANAPSRTVWQGDEVEFVVKTGPGLHDFRQYFLAPNGGWGVLQHPNKDWQVPSGYQHATQIIPRGWSAEMRIPLTEILLEQDHFQANFGLHRRAAQDIEDNFDRWIAWSSSGKETTFEKTMGLLRFSEDAVRVESLGKLGDGILEFRASPGLELLASNLLYDQSKAYAPGSTGKIPWTGLTSLILSGDNFYWASMVNIRAPFTLETECDADQRTISFLFKLSKNDSKLNTLLKAGKLHGKAIILAADGRSIGQAEKALKENQEVLQVAFEDLAQGDYKLRAILDDGDSETCIEKNFSSPDRSFLGNQLGLDSNIPAPWKELKLDGNMLETAFHKYEFGSGPFPVRAWSMGQLVMEQSTGLTLNGAAFRATGNPKTEKTPGQIRSRGQCISADGRIKLSWFRRVDFDGLVHVDFELIPQGGQVTAKGLGIAMFIPGDQCKVAMIPQLEPAWHQGKNISASHGITATGKQGFCVFTDNDTNFVYDKNQQPFLLQHSGDRGKLTAWLFRDEVQFSEPVPYTLCMMATPGKPPRPDWRRIHSEGWLEYPGQNLAIRGWSHEQATAGFKRSYLLTTPENPVTLKQAVDHYAGKGVDCIPYCANNIIPSENAIHDYFAKAWSRPVLGEVTKISYLTDKDGTQYYFGVPVCPNHREFRDYITWYTAKNMDEFGFKGIYFDFGGATATDIPYNRIPLKNVLSRDRKVNIINVFGVRDLYRRLYKTIRQRHENGYLYIHSWRTFHPAYMSFVDLVNPGEEYMHAIARNCNVYIEDKELSAPEVWRYNYNSEVLGVAVQFLPVFHWRPEIKEWFRKGLHNTFQERFNASRAMITMCLLHDVPISGGGYPGIAGMWPAMDALNLDQATFHPHYEQKEITGSTPDIAISYYRFSNSDKLVLILANMSKTPKETLLDCSRFKLPLLTAREVWPETDNHDLKKSILVEGYGFRILDVNP